MVDNKILEKKLSFERMYNYGGQEDIEEYLKNNPELPKFLIENYKKMLKEWGGTQNGYYDSIQNKLRYLEDLQNVS